MLKCQHEDEAHILIFQPHDIIFKSHANKPASPALSYDLFLILKKIAFAGCRYVIQHLLVVFNVKVQIHTLFRILRFKRKCGHATVYCGSIE